MSLTPPLNGDTPSPIRLPDVVMVPPSALKPYDGNAKLHPPEQIERIIASIKRFGFTNPVLAREDGTLVAGHGRQIASLHMGLELIPVIYLKGMTDDEARAYCLADNRLSDLGEWDAAALEAELIALSESAPELVADAGYSKDEVADLLEGGDGTPDDEDDWKDEHPFRCPHCNELIGDDE